MSDLLFDNSASGGISPEPGHGRTTLTPTYG